MQVIIVTHFIFLTREQRYSLIEGNTVEVVGHFISAPANGDMVESTNEIFCKYKLTNNPGKTSLQKINEGFSINLPQEKKPIDDAVYELLDMLPEKTCSTNNLKDICDGGAEYLRFNIKHSKNQMIHLIEIKTIEHLVESFV